MKKECSSYKYMWWIQIFSPFNLVTPQQPKKKSIDDFLDYYRDEEYTYWFVNQIIFDKEPW